MIKYLIDTNVFSKIFKGDTDVAKLVGKLESAVDTTVYIECLQGSKSNQEKGKIKKALDNFPLIHINIKTSQINIKTSQTALDLIDIYSNSHPPEPATRPADRR